VKVTLLAHTKFADHDYDGNLFPKLEHIPWRPELDYVMDMDSLPEFAGRACYQSWNRPNPKTATNEGYLKNILDQKHESVLEHASATFYIEGISRYLTHELVRHRHGQWSQLSTRYVDVTEPVRHPSMSDEDWGDYKLHFDYSVGIYNRKYELMRERGLSKKEAREAARFFLPGGMETKIVMTGNLRAYRDILKKRHHVAADREIQALASEILRQLRVIAPNSFQDIPEEPYE
jgi:thymidylate synthase (FAD)